MTDDIDFNDNRMARGGESDRQKARYVRAGGLEARNESISSDGTETAVTLTEVTQSGTVSDSNGWVDVRDFIRLSLEAHADTDGNGNSCDFTLEGKLGENGDSVDIVAATTVSSDTIDQITTAENIEGYAYVRVLENGTDGDTQEVRVLCK
jgi:hypothetical protein